MTTEDEGFRAWVTLDRVLDMIDEERFDEIGMILCGLALERMDVDHIIDALRLTLCARDRVPGRSSFVLRAWVALTEKVGLMRTIDIMRGMG